jgi:hypothetical protein
MKWLSQLISKSERTANGGSQMTLEYVLCELERVMDEYESNPEIRVATAIALAGGGISCSTHLKTIILDKSNSFYLRRFAMGVAAGCGDPGLNDFIRSNFIAGKNKAELLRIYNSGTEDGDDLGLYVAGEEILNTPDFFQRFMAK